MNFKTFLIQAFFISNFLTISTDCSAKKKITHIDLQEGDSKYLKIEYKYTHGNPNLILTPDNKILNKKTMVLFNMNLSNGEASYYRSYRSSYLKGDTYKFMPRPKAIRAGHPNAIIIR